MQFYSTKNINEKFSLADAAFMGLAPDGGLFMPENIPQVDMNVVCSKANESFADLACYLAGLFFGEDIEKDILDALVKDAYNFDPIMNNIGDYNFTLELFHGPTLAFKDFGARLMGRILGYLNKEEDELVILTATSGDTGSAVANGFYSIDGVRVIILYPKGKVSDRQERQMTTLGKNIFPLKVDGTFDDCQAMVKSIFNDKDFRNSHRVTSANSINILRWIPQAFYYFYSYCKWKEMTGKDSPVVVVPSGNYGNIAAGMLAKKMGLPVKQFVAASNDNDIVPKYLKTGKYNPKPSLQTIANAMDVGAPSNFERMLHLYNNDFSQLCSDLEGYVCNEQNIKKGIKELYEKYKYISDPHSAIGYMAKQNLKADGFWLSTAHCSKFEDVIEDALGFQPEIPDVFKKLLSKEKCFKEINVDLNKLKASI